jgi:eukaryotic-like serine/threonine-protein kinase
VAERAFGPYRLVQQLAVGGMAEIYLAKARGIGGFEKYIALKVIHPNFAEDEHFIKMLIDEAKIAVQLQHVNIAQIFDLGRIGQTYYIAMEFVDGSDLFRTLRRASEIELAMPVELAAFVGQEVCAALDYAHNKKDDFGTPLGIIHRDISPQNVLISYAGEVKLVDFGIAKAAQRLQRTAAGVIKGKYYYMSPEQAWGDPVDSRTDVFSSGILLYEMLVGQMLYLEEDLTILLDRVRKAEIQPPSQVRKDIPRELEMIVMKALAKKPEQRFQSAHELGSALERFLFGYAPDVSAQRLASFLDRVAGDDKQKLDAATGKRGATREVISRADYQPDREHSMLFKVGDLKPAGAPARSAVSPRARNQQTREQAPPPKSDFDDNDGTLIDGPPEFLPELTPPPVKIDDGDGPTSVVDLSNKPRPKTQPPPPKGPPLPGVGVPGKPAARPASAPPRTSGLNAEELFRVSEPVTPIAPLSLTPTTGENTDAPTSPQIGQSRSAVPRAVEVAHPPPRRDPTPMGFPINAPSIVRQIEPGVMRLSSAYNQPAVESAPVPATPPTGPVPVLTSAPSSRGRKLLILSIAAGAALIAGAVLISRAPSPAAAPTHGSLKIVSVPPHASVRFDGKALSDPTPVTVPDVDRQQAHDIEVSLGGYETKKQTTRGDEEVIVVLQEDVGTLDLRSEPAGAEIYINGSPSGSTPQTLRNVPHGAGVALELRLRGYRVYREVLAWEGKRELTKRITLRRSN